MHQEMFTFGCQTSAKTPTTQQRSTHHLLKLDQRLGYRRLAKVKPLSRLTQILLLGNGDKALQMAQPYPVKKSVIFHNLRLSNIRH